MHVKLVFEHITSVDANNMVDFLVANHGCKRMPGNTNPKNISAVSDMIIGYYEEHENKFTIEPMLQNLTDEQRQNLIDGMSNLLNV